MAFLPYKRRFATYFLCLMAANGLAVADVGGAKEKGAEETGVAASVEDGASFRLASGLRVRLASLYAPRPAGFGYVAEPASDGARAGLQATLGTGMLRLETLRPPDRYGRVTARVFTGDGSPVEPKLLEAGWAFTVPHAGDPEPIIRGYYAAEARARAVRRGLWADPYWRVLTPEETAAFLGRFRLVEGRIDNVHPYHGGLYLNFSKEWKGRFSAYIPARDLDAFDAGLLASLPGGTVRLRGWISDHHGPSLDLVLPAQLEKLTSP